MRDIKMQNTTTDDLNNLASLWNDGDVMKFVGYPDGLGVTAESLTKWLGDIENSPMTEHYSIYHNDIGYCGEAFYSVISEHKLGMLDIKLFSKARGKGIGRFALEFAIENAFKTEQCDCVYVDPSRSNKDAWKLYEKLGFKETKRPEYLEPSDVYLELTREVFNIKKVVNEKGYNIDLDGLFLELDLGKIIEQPQTVAGGLLHKSFRVASDKGMFFVKALNPMIMIRPTAMSNFIFSDKVSFIAKEAGVPVSSALEIHGKTIHLYEGQSYQVFKWIDSEALDIEVDRLNICIEIGMILGKIHQIDFSSIYGDHLASLDATCVDWESIFEKSSDPVMCAKVKANVDFNLLFEIENRASHAVNNLPNLLVSHRDLDPKNVMWTSEGVVVIDWEAAGYVNAMHELVEVAHYWSKMSDGQIDQTAFMEVINGYKMVSPIIQDELILALDAINHNKIGWIEYNLKRALGIESNSKDECEMGYQQVIKTIEQIKNYIMCTLVKTRNSIS